MNEQRLLLVDGMAILFRALSIVFIIIPSHIGII